MNFAKKVVYLSYLENGIKVKSVGYIKIEIRDNLLSMDVHVNAKGVAPGGKYEIMAEAEKNPVPVGMIYLQNGVGSFQGEFPVRRIGRKDSVLAYGDITAFRMRLGETKQIEGRLTASGDESLGGKASEREFYATALAGGELHSAILSDGRVSGDEFRSVTRLDLGSSRSGGHCSARYPSPTGTLDLDSSHGGGKKVEGSPEVRVSQESRRPFVQAHDEDVRRKLEEVRLTSGKWQQLLKNYRQIHPYGDERLYIAIEPKDFVIMSGEYQHLAHNSFLLHGFYNYRHIIMGEEQDGYYLGVPGVFYEREKMVAMMFGFEAFECEGGKAENGKFGYYLKKVKI